MKVLLISHTCQSAVEGLPKAEHLAAIRGVELKVLVPNRWKHYGKWRRADVPNASAYRLDVGRVRLPWIAGIGFYLHYYPDLARILREFRPDVIDLWEEPWGLVSAHAVWLKNKICPSAKLVTETEQNINKSLPFPFEQFRRYVLRNADFAVGRSREAVGVLREKGYGGPAKVVPNAVDLSLFAPQDKPQCRKTWDLDGFVVAYVGRLVPEKGIRDLVSAVRQCPEVTLVVAGSGPMESELRELSTGPLHGRIRLLGSVPADQLATVFGASDVLVVPSRTTKSWKEQFGRVIIEAHACGIPVIGSSSGAIPEVVGEGGLIFSEGDIAQLSAAILKLKNDPELARQLGQQGRQAATSKYGWSTVAHQMYEVYAGLMKGTVPASDAADNVEGITSGSLLHAD